MSSFTDTLSTPIGRTAALSFLLTLVFLFFAGIIPLAENTDDAFYSFLYQDLEKAEGDRFNWYLVILESILLSLSYLFMLIFFGSMAEIRNNLPSWGEAFLSTFITLVLTFFFINLSVEGSIAGTDASSGFNHFTESMRRATFIFTIIGIILMTLYMIKSEPVEDR